MAKPNREMVDVVIKENYHTDGAAGYVYVLFFGGILTLALFIIVSYIIATKPQPKYFVTDEQFKIFAGVPVNVPIYNEAQVRDWAAQMVIQLFDMNFINYQARIEQNSKIFTTDGYNKYLSVVSTKDLPTIVNGKFVVKASVCDVVTLDKTRGVFSINNQDTYIWTMNVPLYMQYQSGDKNYNVVARVVVRIQRVSELEYLGGLAINDIEVFDRTTVNINAGKLLPVCNG